MRRALDRIYDGAAYVAALFLVGVLAMVLTSIVSRQLGVHVPGTDAYAGYLMAGSGFLALAHTLKRNEHIRVTLLLTALHGRARVAIELWAHVVATLIAALFAFYAVRLSWQSREFNDISTGIDATPLWLPQLAMAAGSVILVIAFVDKLVLAFRGRSGAPAADGGSAAATEPIRLE